MKALLKAGIALGVVAVFLGILVAGIRSKIRVPNVASPPETFGSGISPNLESTVQVLVWNLYKGKKTGWKEDLTRLTKDADLVLIQEAQLPSEMINTFESTGLSRWDYAKSFSFTSSGDSTGVATGSSVDSSQVVSLRSPGREPIIRTPKMALLTRYPISGTNKPVLVVNVHGLLVARQKRFQQQMQQIAGYIKKHIGPVIFAGDFNTWSESRIGALKQLTAGLGLAEVPFEPDARTRLFGKPIDHAFVRGFDVVSSRVQADIRTSDHKPLLLNLKLAES